MRLATITLWRLRVPLTRPYRVALADIKHFDTILVETTAERGRQGYGEATVLTGYTQETFTQSWRSACAMAERTLGLPTDEAKALVRRAEPQTPFACTALATAIEMTERPAMLESDIELSVPLVGLVHGYEAGALPREIGRLIGQGYRVLKVKVGFDLTRDLERVRTIQHITQGRARLRLDANQGYTQAQAHHFVHALDPESIELFEQPCAAKDWAANEAVAASSPIPIMLDESIYSRADIVRAAAAGAGLVKLKLMKMGTLAALVDALAQARELGLGAVLGNGVACDIGCWMEAMVAARHLDTSGEMNGFLKPTRTLLRQALTVSGGALRVPPCFRPGIDPRALSACAAETRVFQR